MASVVQPDQIQLCVDNAHTPHCLFMNWGIPTETSCLCDPQTMDNLHTVWGPAVMDGIGSASPGVPSQSPGPIDPGAIEYPYVSDSLEPVGPSLEIVHPIPTRVFKPAFLSVENPSPPYSSTPEPEFPCQTPTSSSVDSRIPSSILRTPRSSSCVSQSTSAGLITPTPRAKRSRDAYEGDDEGEGCGEGASDITSSSKLSVRPTWRRRTTKRGSPNYLTTSYRLESSTPTRSSTGSPSKEESDTPNDFNLSPVPSETNIKIEDEYEPEIDPSFNPPPASPAMHVPYLPPPLGYVPRPLPLCQCMCMSLLAARMFRAGWSAREALESRRSS